MHKGLDLDPRCPAITATSSVHSRASTTRLAPAAKIARLEPSRTSARHVEGTPNC